MEVRLFWKNIVTSVVLSILALACTASIGKKSEQAALAQKDDESIITYGEIIIQEPSDYIMIPVQILTEKGLFDKSFEQLSQKNATHEISPRSLKKGIFQARSQLSIANASESGIISGLDSRYKGFNINIVFHNLKTGETHLLLDKQAILYWETLELKKQKDKPVNKMLLLRMIEKDTNGDKKLDELDALAGYLSDLSGKKLQRITPPNTHLVNWKYERERGLIFLWIAKDYDNDKKFTEKDGLNLLKVNINQPTIGTEIISDKIRQKLKSISQ